MNVRCRWMGWRFIVGGLLALTIVSPSLARGQGVASQRLAQESTQTEVSESTIKARLLYKFASFVDWPARVFPARDTPLTICIAGTDPFGPLADEVAEDAVFGARRIEVRRVDSTETSELCHIMFVGRDGGAPENAQARSVLTITDGDDYPYGKGIIHFVVRDNRVRFEIDERAAQQSGLIISSKLLNLAESVRPKG